MFGIRLVIGLASFARHGPPRAERPLAGVTRSLALISMLAAACASSPPLRFAPRPPTCSLETLQTLPQRPYVELETFSLPASDSMREVLDRVQARACQDGADAIYAPKGPRAYEFAIALKWKDAPPGAPPTPSPP